MRRACVGSKDGALAHGNAGFGLARRSAKDGIERRAAFGKPEGMRSTPTARAMDGPGSKAATCHGRHRHRTARKGEASGPVSPSLPPCR